MLISNTLRFGTDVFGFVEEPDEEEGTEQADPVEPEIIVVNEGTDQETITVNEPTITKSFTKKALLIAKTPWNFSGYSSIPGIEITGTEPTGSKRRVMFKYDDKNWRISKGKFVEYTGDLTVENVLKYGNTVSGLNAHTDWASFLNKKVYPIIALSCPSDSDEMPSAKMSIKVHSTVDTLTKTVESIVYELVEEGLPRIVEAVAETNLIGAGTCDIKIRLRDDNDKWTSYMELAEAADREAVAVQFKITYKVTTTDGSDSAKVESICVSHTLGSTIVTGENADLYSIVQDYEIPLQMCYVVVRHEPLIDSSITCYVNFMTAPKTRTLIELGTTTGSRQELVLGVDGKPDVRIDASSIRLYVNGEIVTNFDYNSETSTVVVSAKRGYSIYATYDYNHDVEQWRQMTLDETESYLDEDGTVASRFIYVLPDSEASNKKISNVRIRMKRKTGSASGAKPGPVIASAYATGRRQLSMFRHRPKVSTIKFVNPNVDWAFDEDSQIISFVAPKNTPLDCSYKWRGEPVRIFSFAAGWSVA